MNLPIFTGGVPVIEYMRCRCTPKQFNPSLGVEPLDMSDYGLGELEDVIPPYNAHVDGAYNLGDFIIGMPIIPKDMTWQFEAFDCNDIAVGDVIQCLVMPPNHYAEALRFDVVKNDPNMAGMEVSLIVQEYTEAADGTPTYTDTTELADAATAQGQPATYPIDAPTTGRLFLTKVDGGYSIPLYAPPGTALIFGLKVEALPTNTDYTLADMVNGMFLTVRMRAFECSAGL